MSQQSQARLDMAPTPQDSGLGRANPPRYLFEEKKFNTNSSFHAVNVKVYPSLDNELEKQLYPDKAKLYPDIKSNITLIRQQTLL